MYPQHQDDTSKPDYKFEVISLKKKPQPFFLGGVLMESFYELMGLPGKTLQVAVEIRYLCNVQRTDTVSFSCSRLVHAGVTRDSARRALNVLEMRGFISTERLPGRNIQVKVHKLLTPQKAPNVT